jgi:hypothetical protein
MSKLVNSTRREISRANFLTQLNNITNYTLKYETRCALLESLREDIKAKIDAVKTLNKYMT